MNALFLDIDGFEPTARIFANRWSRTDIDHLCHQARSIGVAA